ncbi:MAG: hypothetical protein ACRDQU_15980, partial [Pseudonocardiaceae bacterium]
TIGDLLGNLKHSDFALQNRGFVPTSRLCVIALFTLPLSPLPHLGHFRSRRHPAPIQGYL